MAKRKEKKFRKAESLPIDDATKPAPSRQVIPAISVIMPLYNVEKYVGEALDSLLAQTFKDFEVLVVDDCSTDSSPAIVESYIPKFDGRLKLVTMKKNSGRASAPRNMGLTLSRGEYIYFMDDDDAIVPDALEILYGFAKNFNADVVQCEKCYEVPEEHWNDAEFIKSLKPSCYPAGERIFVKAPSILTDDIAKRSLEFSQKWLTWNVWLQLIRRDFILKNEIRFGDFLREDMLFVICEICTAKRYVVIPNVLYHYRKREDSALHTKPDILELIKTEINSFKYGIQYLEEFFSQSELFSQRPDLKYTLFDMFAQEILTRLNALYAQIPPHEIDEILRHEFGDNRDALTPFMFSAMNSYRLQLLQSFGRIAALENEIRRLNSIGVIVNGQTSKTNTPPCYHISCRLSNHAAVQRRKICWRVSRQHFGADVQRF